MNDGQGYQPTEPIKTPLPNTKRPFRSEVNDTCLVQPESIQVQQDGTEYVRYNYSAETLDSLISQAKEHQALIDAIQTDVTEQRKRIEWHNHELDLIKEQLSRIAHERNVKKIETGRGIVRVRKSSRLEVVDEDLLKVEYPEYFTVETKLKFEKQKMKDDILKNGVRSDYAKVVETESVTVK